MNKYKINIIFMVISIAILVVIYINQAIECQNYKDELQKRITIMDDKFTDCLKNIDINECIDAENEYLMINKYTECATELRFLAELLPETLYAVYDDESLIGYRKRDGEMKTDSTSGKFASSLRILALYIEGHAEKCEVIDNSILNKLDDLLTGILENIDDKDVCKGYMGELIEFVSGEFI